MKTQFKRIIRLFVISVFCVAIFLGILIYFNFLGYTKGHSMEPTISNMDILFINPFDKTPEPDKIMQFKLFLIDADTREDVLSGVNWMKRVKKIENNCLWIEGDNTDELSSDSRDLGWFCPGEFEIDGTIMFKD